MKKQKKHNIFPIMVSIGSLVITAWIFFDFEQSAWLLLFCLPIEVRQKWRKQEKQRKWELNLAFKDALVCLQNSLAVGYSPESSVRETLKSLEQLYGKEHDICKNFRRMVQQMELGVCLEDVFWEFGQRSNVEDIKQLADMFAVVKRTGGNLSQVLRQTSGVLQDKIELKRELHTTISAKRMEFQIMCVVPYGILLYLRLCAPAMCETLYHNLTGILFMWCAFVAYLGLKLLGEHIVYREVGKLEDGA